MISTAASLSWITVDAIKRLHVIGFLVARLAFLIVVLAVGLCATVKRRRQRRAGADRADADIAKEIATTDFRFVFVLSSHLSRTVARRSLRERKRLEFRFRETPTKRADRP